MSEEKSFDQLIDESMKQIRAGEIVEGTVIAVKPDELVLNIGYKSDGIVSREEYSNDSALDLATVVEVGQKMDVKVLKVNDGDGQVQLSYKRIGEERANKRLEEAFKNTETLAVKVEQVTNGGLIAAFEGSKVFVPASLVSDTFEKDLSKYQDEEIEIVITEFNPHKRRIIGNRKKLLLASRRERARMLLETLKPNDIVDGTVKSVTNFGAFVDLGGVDGLLHISEMSWGRVDSPKAFVKVGDVISVYIKDIADGKIALSAKFPDQNPWVLAREKYAPGTIITGKVARMADFGAFIELEPGIDALLHVSQISRTHVNKPSDVLKAGQEITAKVVDFKEAEKRISLSMRELEAAEEPAVEEPAAEEPAAEAPAVEEPAAEAPAVEEPVAEVPVEEPAAEAPAAEEPAAAEPAVEEPAVEEPVVEESAAEAPATEVPVEEPAAEPAVEEPVAEAPAEEPAAEEPAEESAAEVPAEEPEKTEA